MLIKLTLAVLCQRRDIGHFYEVIYLPQYKEAVPKLAEESRCVQLHFTGHQ